MTQKLLGTITRSDRDSEFGRRTNETWVWSSRRPLRSYRRTDHSIFSVSLRFHSQMTAHAKRPNQRGLANIRHTRRVGWKNNFSDTDYDYPQSSQNISRNNHYASSSVVQRHSRAAHLYRQGSYSTFRAGTKVRIRPVSKKAMKQCRDPRTAWFAQPLDVIFSDFIDAVAVRSEFFSPPHRITWF